MSPPAGRPRRRPGSFVRRQVNRVAAVALLVVALPQVALAEKLGAGRGRRAAVRWLRRAGRLTGVRFESRGTGHLRPGVLQVLAPNHSSLMDAAALLVTCPDVSFVAGADLFRIPLLAGAMRALGTVPVDRRSGGGTRLELGGDGRGDGRGGGRGGGPVGGGPVVVFPEGRLAAPGTRLPFRRSAFAAAVEHRAPVVPVAIHNSSGRLAPGSRLGVVPGTVLVEFLPAIDTADLTPDDRYRLCEEAEAAVLDALGPADGGRGGGPDGGD